MTRYEESFRAGLVALLPRLRRFGFSLTGSPHESSDLVQAACERALSRSHQWSPGSRLDSWMFSIMHSLWKNELRAQRIRREKALEYPNGPMVVDGVQEIEGNLMANAVLQAVMTLPEVQRAALLLVYVEGYTYKEAAEILGVPVGTVMSRLARARLALADRLEPSQSSVHRRSERS